MWLERAQQQQKGKKKHTNTNKNQHKHKQVEIVEIEEEVLKNKEIITIIIEKTETNKENKEMKMIFKWTLSIQLKIQQNQRMI